MKNVRDAGFSRQRGGNAGSGPPLPDPPVRGLATGHTNKNICCYINPLCFIKPITNKALKHHWIRNNLPLKSRRSDFKKGVD